MANIDDGELLLETSGAVREELADGHAAPRRVVEPHGADPAAAFAGTAGVATHCRMEKRQPALQPRLLGELASEAVR